MNWNIKNYYRETYQELLRIKQDISYLESQYKNCQEKIIALGKNNPKFFCPERILNESDISVRECFAKIIGANKKLSSTKLIERLCVMSQGILERSIGSKTTYKDVVEAVCKKLTISRPLSPDRGEQAIALHCFKEMYQNLSPTQQKEYETALRKQVKSLEYLNPSLAPSMITASAIVAGQMSGFGVYLAASTLVGTITSTIGVTLPFVFYTTMSSTISVFLGPIGWMAVGAMVVGTLFAPDFKKVTKGIILIASVRAEKELEWKAMLKKEKTNLKKVGKEICKHKIRILTLRSFLFAYWFTIPMLSILAILIVFLTK